MSKQKQKLYQVWNSMKNRCSNPANRVYKYYGARGIRVCERWLNDFWTFVADMGPRPQGASIDRINNDGNYEPGNCRWATYSQQNQNKRMKLLEFDGKTQPISKWAREYGLTPAAIHSRLQLGWTVADAITKPVRNWVHAKARPADAAPLPHSISSKPGSPAADARAFF